MKLTLINLGQIAAAITAIFVLGSGIDSRYATAEAVDTYVYTVASDRERGDITNQIELIQLELKYLKAKSNRDSDDEAREDMLRAKLAVLLSRLQELQK